MASTVDVCFAVVKKELHHFLKMYFFIDVLGGFLYFGFIQFQTKMIWIVAAIVNSGLFGLEKCRNDWIIQSSPVIFWDWITVQFLYSNYVTSEFTACSLTTCFLQHGLLKINSWLSLGFIWGIWRRFLLPQERDLSIILYMFFDIMSRNKKHSCLTSTSDSL